MNIKGQNKGSLVTELKKRVTALTIPRGFHRRSQDNLVTQQFSLDKGLDHGTRASRFSTDAGFRRTYPTAASAIRQASKFSEGLAHIADVEIQDMTPTVKDQDRLKENKVNSARDQRKPPQKRRLSPEAAGVKLGRVYAIFQRAHHENYSRKREIDTFSGTSRCRRR